MTSPTPPKITGIPLLGQVTGTPGAPGATTTIDGRYLPAPQQPFIGHIEPNAAQSTPAWPLLTGPPNVVLIMIDDEGFGAPSNFGSLIPTPTMDRIAKMGLTYTRFHTILPFRTTLLAMSNGRRRWRT